MVKNKKGRTKLPFKKESTMYELVCIDLDGTLLNHEKKISPLNVKVLNALHQKGIDIVIATGRHFEKVEELISSLNFKGSIIANNGAIALENDEIFILNPVEEDLYRTVWAKGQDYGLIPYLHVFDKERKVSLVIPDGEPKIAHRGSVCTIDHICYYGEIDFYYDILTIVFLENRNRISTLYSDIINSGYACEAHIITAFRKDIVMAEFLQKGSNKATAINHYASLKGIDPSKVITIGDENNDIDMIKEAGIGIAMANSTKSLKDHADVVSNYSNDDSGVGRELMKIFDLKIEGADL